MGFLPYLIMIISNVSPLPAIVAGRRYRNTLWYYALACIAADIAGLAAKYIVDSRHTITTNLFLLIEFALISTYFVNMLWRRQKMQLAILLLLIGGFYVVNTVISMSQSGAHTDFAYNYFGASLFYFTYIIFSLMGLFRVMQKVDVVRLERSPLFLSSVAMLLYASGALFLLLFKDLIVKADIKLFGNLWIYFFLPLNIIKNLLIALSLYYASVAGKRSL